jgi:hypothetical protein
MGFDFKVPKGVTNCGESGEGGTIGKNDLAHISILLSESEPESVSSDADLVSLELSLIILGAMKKVASLLNL